MVLASTLLAQAPEGRCRAPGETGQEGLTPKNPHLGS